MIKLKNLLTEGKYDRITTEISRWVIDNLKKHKRGAEKEFDIPSVGGVDITVVFLWGKQTRSGDPEVEAESSTVAGIEGNEEIEIKVEIPTEKLDKTTISLLIPLLKNFIRHEIEHIVDIVVRGQKKISTKYLPNKKYLMHKVEIPAFVAGLYKQAKTQRVPLGDLIDWYVGLYDDLSDKDKELIIKTWKDFARKTYPRAQL